MLSGSPSFALEKQTRYTTNKDSRKDPAMPHWEYNNSTTPRTQYAIETRSPYTSWEWGLWKDWHEEDDLNYLIKIIEKDDPCTGEVEFRIVEREVSPKKVHSTYPNHS